MKIGVASVLLLRALSTSACVPAGGAVRTILDVGDAVCETLLAEDVGGDKVRLVCKYVDKADSVARIFMATVLALKPAGLFPVKNQ